MSMDRAVAACSLAKRLNGAELERRPAQLLRSELRPVLDSHDLTVPTPPQTAGRSLRLVSPCFGLRFPRTHREAIPQSAWLSEKWNPIALPVKATVSKARLCRLFRQHNTSICREFTGATGLEPATSGVTGRNGITDYSPLQPGITGYSRRLVDSRTGCDRLRPASTRHSLCGSCVVALVPNAATHAGG
jgi:hypothetical protein